MNKELFALSYSIRKQFERRVLLVISFAIGIFAVVNLIASFVIFPVRQHSVSMQPDIAKDSCLMFSPLKKTYGRGDIVLVRPLMRIEKRLSQNAIDMAIGFFTARQLIPSAWNGAMGGSPLVRRVIGLPGDTIYMRDYVMYIKPAGEKSFLTEFELIAKPYNVNIIAPPAAWDVSIGANGSFETLELAENQYFVLGDGRVTSIDSRMWGPVPKKSILAAAALSYFPFNRIRFF